MKDVQNSVVKDMFTEFLTKNADFASALTQCDPQIYAKLIKFLAKVYKRGRYDATPMG